MNLKVFPLKYLLEILSWPSLVNAGPRRSQMSYRRRGLTFTSFFESSFLYPLVLLRIVEKHLFTPLIFQYVYVVFVLGAVRTREESIAASAPVGKRLQKPYLSSSENWSCKWAIGATFSTLYLASLLLSSVKAVPSKMLDRVSINWKGGAGNEKGFSFRPTIDLRYNANCYGREQTFSTFDRLLDVICVRYLEFQFLVSFYRAI